MLRGYVDAYRALGKKEFLDAALRNADFLTINALSQNNAITRNYKNGKSSIPGMLDDFAFTPAAFIGLYQATFDEKWLYRAKELTDYSLLHFFDNSSGMFYYTSDDHSNLIARKMEIADNVIPSSNSEMAMNLYLMGQYFDNGSYTQKATEMLEGVQKDMSGNIFYYSNWGKLEIHFNHQLYEVAIVGEDWESIRKTIDNSYLPDVIFLGGRDEGTLPLLRNKHVPGRTTIYVCVERSCKIPVSTAEEALEQIENRQF